MDQAAEPRLLSLRSATPQDWRLVIDALAPFMREKRVRLRLHTLKQRRKHLHLVVENLQDPHNVAVVLRTAEGLGVQHVHVIESLNDFQLPATEANAAGRGALGRSQDGAGAGRWLTVTKYSSSEEAAEALRALGLRIFVSDCPTGEADDEVAEGEAMPRELSSGTTAGEKEGMGWVVAKRGQPRVADPISSLNFGACFEGSGQGAALVFGNERRGVSRALVDGADASFYLPMSGFTQSFNIGVALAMSLTAAIGTGHFPTGTLTEDEVAERLGRWLLRDIKASRSLLLQAGLEFEDL